MSLVISDLFPQALESVAQAFSSSPRAALSRWQPIWSLLRPKPRYVTHYMRFARMRGATKTF